MIELRACVDVDDLEEAIAFYRDALGLQPGRRQGDEWVEMLGASTPIDLLAVPCGEAAWEGGGDKRRFDRHWTPVHLDFAVRDLERAVEQVRAAGGTLDRAFQSRVWGRMANCADPFGNGFCLLELNACGYDALVGAPAGA